MVSIITGIVLFLFFFVNQKWIIVFWAFILLHNSLQLLRGWKGRKSDPIEWHKRLVLNGIAVIIMIGLICQALI